MTETVVKDSNDDLTNNIINLRKSIRQKIVDTQTELAKWIASAEYGDDPVIMAVALMDTAFDLCLSVHEDADDAFDLIRRDFQRAVDRRNEKL